MVSFLYFTWSKIRFLSTGELDPLMKGLQDLKYSPEENTSEELAKNYKEDGNFQFKVGS